MHLAALKKGRRYEAESVFYHICMVCFEKGYFDDPDVRVHAYWNFLAGACGYTENYDPYIGEGFKDSAML
ncbi:MAG: hypothetical protein U5R06_00215 [candidate division KSB1 bacterium]|nr:hypothetical protein [candidate division KSB1 bacterium]